MSAPNHGANRYLSETSALVVVDTDADPRRQRSGRTQAKEVGKFGITKPNKVLCCCRRLAPATLSSLMRRSGHSSGKEVLRSDLKKFPYTPAFNQRRKQSTTLRLLAHCWWHACKNTKGSLALCRAGMLFEKKSKTSLELHVCGMRFTSGRKRLQLDFISRDPDN